MGQPAKCIGGEFLMADYLVTDKDLILVADAIRAKSGTSGPMAWPNGYKEAIEAINAKSTLHVKTGTFTLAEDTQAPAVTHNLGVIPDLVIVEAADHDNTPYSIFGFVAVNPALLSCEQFGGVILINNATGMESSGLANTNGKNAFNDGLSDTRFVCAYNSGNYKYHAGWTYKWTAIASIQSGGGGGAKEPYVEETYNANGELIEANLVGYTAVRDYAFSNCTNLALISLPSGLVRIGSYAFSKCTSLALTSLPSGLTSIEVGAFYGCTSLALTSLPSGLTSIKSSAFNSCTNLALTSLPSGLTSIKSSVFNSCTSLALTSLPNGLTSIGDYTFYGCTNLALTSLPSGLARIGNYAFDGCTGLTSITFQGKPNSLSPTAFNGCTNLKTINVPWASGEVANAPWGATNATINYNYIEE